MAHKYPKQVLASLESIDAETINRNRREITEELGYLDGDNFADGIFDSDALRLSHYADDILFNVAQDHGVAANAGTGHLAEELREVAFNEVGEDVWRTYASKSVTVDSGTLWVLCTMTIGASLFNAAGLDWTGATGRWETVVPGEGVFAIRINGRMVNDSANFFVDRGFGKGMHAVIMNESEFFIEVPRGTHLIELVAKRNTIGSWGGVLNPNLIVIEIRS
mgnify:CR=1 FL=1